jgi:hypothetical protein
MRLSVLFFFVYFCFNHTFCHFCRLLDNNNLSGYLPEELSELPSLLIMYVYYFEKKKGENLG